LYRPDWGQSWQPLSKRYFKAAAGPNERGDERTQLRSPLAIERTGAGLLIGDAGTRYFARLARNNACERNSLTQKTGWNAQRRTTGTRFY
jgi:hypothetical protein